MKKLIILTTSAAIIAGGAFLAIADGRTDSKPATDKSMMHKKDGHNKGYHKGKMLKAMDSNSDGMVSKSEFLKHATDKFSKMDVNGDGNITQGEIEQMHKNMRTKHGKNKKEMDAKHDKRFKTMDADDNGSVSKDKMDAFRESKKMMNHKKKEKIDDMSDSE